MGEKYHYKNYVKSFKKKLAYKTQKGGVETRNTQGKIDQDEIEEFTTLLSNKELTPFEDDYLNKLWNEIKETDSSEDESKEDSSNLDTFFKKRFKRRLKHIRANKPLIPTNIQESLKELDEKGMELKKKTEELEELEKEKRLQVPASQSRTQRRRAQRARRKQRDKKIILKEEIDEKDKILKEKIDEFSRILSKRDETETIIEGHLWEPDAGEKPIKITLDRNYESGPILVNIGQNLPPIEVPTTGSNLYKYDSAIKVNVPVGAKAGDIIYINKSQIMIPNVPVTFAHGEIQTPKKLVFEIQKGVWQDSKNIDSKYNIQKNVDKKSLGFYDPQGYHGDKRMVLDPDTFEDDEEDDEEDNEEDESQESYSYSPSNVSSLTTTPVNNDDSDENDDGKEDFVSHRFEEDDLVEALYMDGNWYNAKIQSLEADGRYFIEWTDPRLRHGVSRSSKFTTINDDELRPGQTLRPWSIRNDSLVHAVEKDDDDEDDDEDDEEDESQESSSYSPSNVSSLTTTQVKVAESSPL